jgi:AAHS family 4-hydroxybenzoate transporter-like MFS transporter
MRGTALDIGTILGEGSWGTYQKLLTALAAVAVTFDGFDIQILGFAIPSIMKDWHLARAAFAPVLAIGLVGMAAGSPLAGYIGDRFGRRIALMQCVVLFGAATIATAFCHGLTELTILRFLTGIGAGGTLPNAAAFSAEFSPIRRRPVAVALTIVCIPLGGMVGGVAASKILTVWNWHVLYLAGGVAPMVVAVLLLLLLPESPRYLARHPARWPELTRLLNRMGHDIPSEAGFFDAVEQAAEERSGIRSIVGADYIRDTIGLCIAFFAALNASYLVFGWLPAMLTAHGLDVGAASSALASLNFGGVIGVLVFAWLISTIGSRWSLTGCGLAGAASAGLLLFIPIRAVGDHLALMAAMALFGVFLHSLATCTFAVAAHVYPTKVRSTGIAVTGAVGRIGGILSSYTGAALIQSGSGTFLWTLVACMVVASAGIAMVTRHYRRQ